MSEGIGWGAFARTAIERSRTKDISQRVRSLCCSVAATLKAPNHMNNNPATRRSTSKIAPILIRQLGSWSCLSVSWTINDASEQRNGSGIGFSFHKPAGSIPKSLRESHSTVRYDEVLDLQNGSGTTVVMRCGKLSVVINQ